MRFMRFAVLLAAACSVLAGPAPTRSVVDLDAGWRFVQGDPAGSPMARFDDSGWATVDVPHDWSAAGPFGPGHGSGNGFAPGGVGWYRRHFRAAEAGAWTHCQVLFDGVYDHAQVWVNGQYAGAGPTAMPPSAWRWGPSCARAGTTSWRCGSTIRGKPIPAGTRAPGSTGMCASAIPEPRASTPGKPW